MTATYPARTGLRPCRLYRFHVHHPLTGEVVLGYVGETGRQPFQRLLEHLADQPWFDTVVRWEIDPQVYYGKTAVLEVEAAAIRAERPLHNVIGNERNDERVIPPDAIRQRRARDAQAGGDRWVHPDDRGLQPRVDRSSPIRPRAKRKPFKRWQKYATGWAVAWPGSTLSGWILALLEHWGGWEQTLVGAASVLPGLLLFVRLALGMTASKRTRRKVMSKLTGWPW